MKKKKIKINKENLNIIKNLRPGDLITIKHKNLQGKVVLRVLNDDIRSYER